MSARYRIGLFSFIILISLVLSLAVSQDSTAQGSEQSTPTPGAIISIQGPVQAINGSVVTVDGIGIIVNPNDPVLATLQVGDLVVITGSVSIEGNTISILATNIFLTNTIIPTLTPSVVQTPEVTPDIDDDDDNDDNDDIDDNDDDDDLPVIIVIEGPVQAININIITIYNINIEVNINDPILTVIQIGDMIKVEGVIKDNNNDDDDDDDGGSTTIVIIAVTVIIINVEVFINNDSGQVWRDNEGCGNAPPPWAPAVGWRRRCQGGNQGGGNQGGGNQGGGRGRGNDDDDDD